MGKLIRFVVFLVILLGIVGWWRDWFSFERTGDDSVTITVDRDKLSSDTRNAVRAARDAADDLVARIESGEVVKVAGEVRVMQDGNLFVQVEGDREMNFELGPDVLEDGARARLTAGQRVTIYYEPDGDTPRVVKIEFPG